MPTLDIVFSIIVSWLMPSPATVSDSCPYAGVSVMITAPCPGTKSNWKATGAELLTCPSNDGKNRFAVGCVKDRSATFTTFLVSLKPGEESFETFSCPPEAPLMAMVCLDEDHCEDSSATARLSYVGPAS